MELSQKTYEWSQKELNFKAEIFSINQYAKTIHEMVHSQLKSKQEENLTLKRAILEVERQVCILRRSLYNDDIYLYSIKKTSNFNTDLYTNVVVGMIGMITLLPSILYPTKCCTVIIVI